MLVKRRLGMLAELMQEFCLQLRVDMVASEKNRADALTRVKKSWLLPKKDVVAASDLDDVGVRELHNLHHMGVERTWYLVKKVDPRITKEQVRQVVKTCDRCQSIDPAPSTHEAGQLEVSGTWERLTCDVTHYRGGLYLTMIDCGPGRFALWKKLRGGTGNEIAAILDEVFLERGPVEELLTDNGTAFKSVAVTEVLKKWKIQQFFRAAYRPSGNGIVERNHRTIKAVAERGGTSPEQAVFWYNMSPKLGQVQETVLQLSTFTYSSETSQGGAGKPRSRGHRDN